MKENIIKAKTFEFACKIIDLEEELIQRKKFVLSRQVCRSGLSIGANVREAQRAVSKPDFINKLGIALKEADETQYWFELIDLKVCKLDKELKNDIEEIIKLLVAIINSSKKQKVLI